MTNDQTDAAFQTLHDAQRQAQMLYMDLRDAGDETGAASAKLRVNRLQTEIDNLINKELDDWQANAEKLIPQLSDMVDAVQEAVEAVEADVKNAQKVVQAMKALDKIISTAVKFIG
jgi:predicted  nucleic acid-binding Zn-ribbon protein